jgi:plastocyanin
MDIMTLAMAKAETEKLKKSGGVGYAETAQTVLLDGVFEIPEVEGGLSGFECEYLELKAGDTVTVKWNGVQYTCVVFDIEGSIGFGNLAVMGADINTGEPFMFGNAVDEDGTSYGMFLTYEHGSVTVTVSITTETIHPIDPKYLPGVCLPVVEFTTTLGTNVTLTSAENEALTKVAVTASPVLIKANLDMGNGNAMPVRAVFNYFAGAFGFSAMGYTFQFMPSDAGVWAFSIAMA